MLFQFFAAEEVYVAVAWVLALLGVAVLGIGVLRFRTVKKELELEIQDQESTPQQ